MHDISKTIEWVCLLKSDLKRFLTKLNNPQWRGYYSYSLSGDIYNPASVKWGLGNTVFAAKTYYMLNVLDEADVPDMIEFIKSFQTDTGEIFDPLIERKSFPRRLYNAVKTLDFNNINNKLTKTAETRQAFAALRCLHDKPDIPYKNVPCSKEEIKTYIQSLNWREPWGAGSHVSHLLFFLKNNSLFFEMHKDQTDLLIDYSLELLNYYQQEDGSWYAEGSDLPAYHKVNAAMKIMTAYDAAGRNDFFHPEKLIDLCLSAVNEGDACNNFNIICVLYHCSRKTDYRAEDIKQYCLKKLETYQMHYWPDYGGFSFFKRNANSVYYGARISRGLGEPDIHGTTLFLWGITLISKILEIDDKITFNIPIT